MLPIFADVTGGDELAHQLLRREFASKREPAPASATSPGENERECGREDQNIGRLRRSRQSVSPSVRRPVRRGTGIRVGLKGRKTAMLSAVPPNGRQRKRDSHSMFQVACLWRYDHYRRPMAFACGQRKGLCRYGGQARKTHRLHRREEPRRGFRMFPALILHPKVRARLPGKGIVSPCFRQLFTSAKAKWSLTPIQKRLPAPSAQCRRGC